MTFIHQDLGITDYSVIESVRQEQFISETLYQIYKTEKGYWLIRYPSGLSIMQSPFYLSGHAYASLSSEYVANGFTRPYQIALNIGGMFYLSSGILILRNILLKWFSDMVTALSLLAVFFGTNLENQAVLSTTMPHVMIFFLYTLIILYTIKWHDKTTLKNGLILGGTLGLAVICRPTEIVAVLIPVFWGVKNPLTIGKKIKFHFKNNRKVLLTTISTFLGVIFIQMLYWKIYAGHFIFNSYNNPGEGLDLLSPHTLNTLFSFRKGWFIYTPIMLFFVFGFLWLKRKKPAYFWSLFLFFIFNLYLVSSWTNWWYAGSFGQRALVQSYAALTIVFAFMVSYIIKSKKKMLKSLFYSGLILFVSLNMFQSWQYKKGIIHDSRMTFDYYKATFLKTSKPSPDKDKLLLYNSDLPFEEALKTYDHHEKVIYYNDFDKEENTVIFNGEKAQKIDKNLEFSPSFKIEYSDITNKDNLWIKVNFRYYTNNTSGELNLVNLMEGSAGVYGYSAQNIFLKIDSNSTNTWKEATYYYSPPPIRNKNDVFTTYFWNVSKNEVVYIDKISITAYNIK